MKKGKIIWIIENMDEIELVAIENEFYLYGLSDE